MTSSMMAASTSTKGSGLQLTFMKAMGINAGNPSLSVNIPSSSSSSSASAFSSSGASSAGPLIATGGVIPGNTAANPYIEGQGMGRGKHLTKPSWSSGDGNSNSSLIPVTEYPSGLKNSSSAAPSSSAMKLKSDQFDDAPQSSSFKGSDNSVAPKRSRFSASTSPLEGIPVSVLQPPSHIEAPNEGYQVMTDSGSSSNSHRSNITVASAKRSRWDQ